MSILDCDESDPEGEPQEYKPSCAYWKPNHPQCIENPGTPVSLSGHILSSQQLCALFLYSPVALLSSKRLVASGLH